MGDVTGFRLMSGGQACVLDLRHLYEERSRKVLMKNCQSVRNCETVKLYERNGERTMRKVWEAMKIHKNNERPETITNGKGR